jgi:hypothetical protein
MRNAENKKRRRAKGKGIGCQEFGSWNAENKKRSRAKGKGIGCQEFGSWNAECGK